MKSREFFFAEFAYISKYRVNKSKILKKPTTLKIKILIKLFSVNTQHSYTIKPCAKLCLFYKHTRTSKFIYTP